MPSYGNFLLNHSCRFSQPQGILRPSDTLSTMVLIPVFVVNLAILSPNPLDSIYAIEAVAITNDLNHICNGVAAWSEPNWTVDWIPPGLAVIAA